MPSYKYLPARLAETLKGAGLPVRRPVHGAQIGRHRSPHHGSSVEFAEYRSYSPGDPTSLIDWPVYARTDRYMIRQFYEETNMRGYVLLDISGSLGFRGDGPMSKMDCASYLAAGMLYTLVSQRDFAGMITFDAKMRDIFKPAGSAEGLRPLLLHLEGIAPEGEGDIEAAIHQATAVMKKKSLVVLISDLLQDADRILRGIRHLYHDGHNIVVLHVMDRAERKLSLGDVAELRDLETKSKLVIEVDEIRDAYERAVRHHLEKIRVGCNECLAVYRLVDTADQIETVLGGLFRG
ncbi:MAG: DUF58 domain-containing protein [Kiritimatiellia bacterium]